MTFFCALRGHLPSEDVIANGGYTFSRCTRCSADLVEEDGRWAPPPRGFRIVWRKAEGEARPSESTGPSPLEVVTNAEGPIDPADRRARPERRVARDRSLPNFLAGKDRRRSRDRRAGFGKKARPSIA